MALMLVVCIPAVESLMAYLRTALISVSNIWFAAEMICASFASRRAPNGAEAYRLFDRGGAKTAMQSGHSGTARRYIETA